MERIVDCIIREQIKASPILPALINYRTFIYKKTTFPRPGFDRGAHYLNY